MRRSTTLTPFFATPLAAPAAVSAPSVGHDMFQTARQWLRRVMAAAPMSFAGSLSGLRPGTHSQTTARAAMPHPLRTAMPVQAIESTALRARALPAARPVRVVRIVDNAGRLATPVTRMRISGRMSDVCAELDRMVERESAALSARG